MTHQDELAQIERDNGGLLRPEDVVEFAKNPKTALHSKFEWDDTKAGHAYRLEQARGIIRVVITYEPGTDAPPIRKWVSLASDRKAGNGYREVGTVMADEAKRNELLSEARREMRHFRKKYESLASYGIGDVIESMSKAEAKLARKSPRTMVAAHA